MNERRSYLRFTAVNKSLKCGTPTLQGDKLARSKGGGIIATGYVEGRQTPQNNEVNHIRAVRARFSF